MNMCILNGLKFFVCLVKEENKYKVFASFFKNTYYVILKIVF
jgi:hypothetical protein